MRTLPVVIVALAACGRGAAHDADAVPAPREPVGVDAPTACDGAPRPLGPGLTAERWATDGHPASAVADTCIDVVRIDLRHYRPVIGAMARGATSQPAPAWADALGAAAIINLGMFRDDGLPVAMAVDAHGALTARDNPRFGGFLAFDPVDPADPPVTIAGRGCDGFDLPALRRRYRAIVQSYRLLDCDGRALGWKDSKAYSAAAIGLDRDGRLALIHVRAPYTMAALARMLARPALGLRGAIFVEGGPEASLVARGPDGAVARVGSFETAFLESDDNTRFWDLPNVIAIVGRDPEAPAPR